MVAEVSIQLKKQRLLPNQTENKSNVKELAR